MAQGNVRLSREVFKAVKEQDASRLVELADPDVHWRSFFAVGGKGVYRGHDGLRQYVDDLAETWEALAPDPAESVAVGSIVLWVGRIRYRGRGSGAETESPAGWVFKFRDGKVVEFRAFRDPEQALEAIGLSD